MPYRDPERQRQYQREWVSRRRAAWFADKICEQCDGVECLELHHKDTLEKISHRIWSWSEVRRLAELAKCIVLCRECHDMLHYSQCHSYRLGCRCPECTEAHRLRHARYRATLRTSAVEQRPTSPVS